MVFLSKNVHFISIEFHKNVPSLDHPYLVEKITGQTTADHTDNNKILREVCADITARAHVPCLTDHFLTHNVLNDRDREKIEAEQRAKGQTSACFVMLTLIPRRISNWYEILKRVLRENEMKDIADKMEAHEKELKGISYIIHFFLLYSDENPLEPRLYRLAFFVI